MQTTANRKTQAPGEPPAGRPAQPLASVIDLFCGAGALSHGFLLEGFSIACGYDIDETCRFAFEENNNAPFVRRDVAEIDPQELAREFADSLPKVLVGNVHLAKPFSSYSQGREDPKWKLLEEFTRLVLEILPDVVSMENVPPARAFQGWDGIRSLRSKFGGCWLSSTLNDCGLHRLRHTSDALASRLDCVPPRLSAPAHTRR